VVDADRGTPLYSSRADDLEVREALDEFVVTLAERIDRIQDAEARGDFKQIADLCGPLAGEAEQLGFQPLARIAEVVQACAREEKAEETHQHLLGLTGIARRIRLGHRGAV
jgi:HPt (histidine-containing phosphotransfer) domain-containing protein